MIYDAVDCFSGAGGWAEGLASLGLATVGIELDADAAATHAKAGHATVRADVSVYPPERFAGRVAGVIASPPCQAFSQAGKREGGSREDAQTIDPAERPAPAITAKSGGQWQLTPEEEDERPERLRVRGTSVQKPSSRSVDEPAPTLSFGHNAAGWEWLRPATTLMGDARVFPPGGHRANDGRDNDAMVGRSEDARRLEPEEALVLQSFPADYPVVGTKTSQHRQIGNAVPPLLARAIVRAVID